MIGQSHQTVPKLLLSTFFHIPERSIALVKRLAGSPKAEIDPNLPHRNKVLPKVAHAFLYLWTSFSTKLCPAVAILPSSIFPERSLH
jgi:hypothetical protein